MLKHIIRFCFGAAPTIIILLIVWLLSTVEPTTLATVAIAILSLLLICSIYLLGYLLYDCTYKYFKRR